LRKAVLLQDCLNLYAIAYSEGVVQVRTEHGPIANERDVRLNQHSPYEKAVPNLRSERGCAEKRER